LADSNVNNSSQQQEDDPRSAPGPSQPSAGHGSAVPSRPVPDAFGPPPYSCSPLDAKGVNVNPSLYATAPGVPLPVFYGPVAQPPYPAYPGTPMPPSYPFLRVVGPPKGLAVASMVLGICSLPVSLMCSFMNFVGVVLGIIALILGVAALAKCRKNTASGRGMAIAGVVTGACGIVLGVFLTVLWYTMMFSSMP